MDKTLALFARPIPYYGSLRPMTGGISASILMVQLEYWFDLKKDGFYKFLEPCEHDLYRESDSWTEELSFTAEEFRTAFNKLGIRYKSKREYSVALAKKQAFFDDSGKEAMYASYHDKIKGLTFYFRNHHLVDENLKALREGSFAVNQHSPVTETGNPDLRKPGMSVSVNQHSPVHLYTEDYIREYKHKAHTDSASSQLSPVPEFEESEKPDTTQQVNNSPAVKNEINHNSQMPAPFDKPEQTKYKQIDSLDELVMMPNGKKQLPWENAGRSLNNKYDEAFAEWLYDNHLKNWGTGAFSKDGYPKNKSAVRGYLLKAHSEALRLEKVVEFWNDFVSAPTQDASSNQKVTNTALDAFLAGCGDKIRGIVLNGDFTQQQLAYIADLWQTCDRKESLTIMMLKDEGLI